MIIVSILIVGQSYTRNMKQNFLAFRDSPTVPLRRSPKDVLSTLQELELARKRRGMDGPNKGSFNEQSLQTITHKSSLRRAEHNLSHPSITRAFPSPLHPSIRFLHIAVLLFFLSLQLRWGSACGERKWVYGTDPTGRGN